MAHYRELYWFRDESLAINERADVFPRNSNIHLPIFSDAGMTIPMANPTATDGSGYLDFYCPPQTVMIFIKGIDFERHVNDGDDLTSGSFVKEYKTLVGDNINTTYTITHNLGNVSPSHTIELAATNEEVTAAVVHVDANTLTVTFNDVATTDQYSVTIHG